ncbi:hypothetical protein LN996_02985 [Arthrobacter sp. AK01]|nr:hypothetical protein [Arthrobacter sp. AK01]MCD4849771.1 hypothetical protein [Arthrobacter sp. AK01]
MEERFSPKHHRDSESRIIRIGGLFEPMHRPSKDGPALDEAGGDRVF